MADIKSFPNNQDVYIGAESVMKWLHGRTSGVFGAQNNAAVSAVSGAMAVTVSDGVGWIANGNGDGVVWWNDEEAENGSKLQLVVDTADGVLNRIDRVVVSWETTNYVALPTISILKGTAASNPTAPALTNNSTMRQISLARIAVNAGTLSISPSMITDERMDGNVCGIVTDTVNIDTSMINAQAEALLNSIQAELAEIEAGTGVELKKLQFDDQSVAISSFVADSTYEDYPYRAEVPLTNVLSTMIPQVILGVSDAVSGIFAPVAESYNGGIYLYASDIPEATVTIPTIILWRGNA